MCSSGALVGVLDDRAADLQVLVGIVLVGNGERDPSVAPRVGRPRPALGGVQLDEVFVDMDRRRHDVGRPVLANGPDLDEVGSLEQLPMGVLDLGHGDRFGSECLGDARGGIRTRTASGLSRSSLPIGLPGRARQPS